MHTKHAFRIFGSVIQKKQELVDCVCVYNKETKGKRAAKKRDLEKRGVAVQQPQTYRNRKWGTPNWTSCGETNLQIYAEGINRICRK